MRHTITAGFSLIELLVVMLVLSILAMATYPLAEVTAQRERERELRRALWEIRDAIDAYKRASDAGLIRRSADASGYPPTLLSLAEGAPSERKPGERMYFLRRVPRDPFSDTSLPAEQSWGLRSYQSAPDRPSPGDDVYDVFSTSSRTGLNGVPLVQW